MVPAMNPPSTRYGASGCAAGGRAVDFLDQHAARRLVAASRPLDEHAGDGARRSSIVPARRPAGTPAAAGRRAPDRRPARRSRESPWRRRCASARAPRRHFRPPSSPSSPRLVSSACSAGSAVTSRWPFQGGAVGIGRVGGRQDRDLGLVRLVAQRAQQIDARRAGRTASRRGRPRNSRGAAARSLPSLSAPDTRSKPPGISSMVSASRVSTP